MNGPSEPAETSSALGINSKIKVSAAISGAAPATTASRLKIEASRFFTPLMSGNFGHLRRGKRVDMIY